MKRIFVRNTWIKNAAGMCLLWLLLTATPCAAFSPLSERTVTRVSGDLVNVSIDFGDDLSQVPLDALTHALVAYPKLNRFRVIWMDGELQIFHNNAALYDRRKHTVTFYSTATEADNNGRTSFSAHLRFTKVQEEDFQKIAAAHKNDRDDWSWLDDLPKYGSREYNLVPR